MYRPASFYRPLLTPALLGATVDMQAQESDAQATASDEIGVLMEQALRHARRESVVREMAKHGRAFTGTSILEYLQRNPVRMPVVVPPRRYNLLDRLGHICIWLLNDTPIPAQPRLPTAVPGPSRLPKGPIRV